MLKLLIIVQKRGVDRGVLLVHKSPILFQLSIQSLFLLLDLLDQPDHGAVVSGHDVGQCQTVKVHHRLFDLIQLCLADHVLIHDGPGVSVDIVDADHRQDVGQHHHCPQQKNRQKQPLLQRHFSFHILFYPPFLPLPGRNALHHIIQLFLKRRAGGIALCHAPGKFRHRVPELPTDPLELGIL